MLLTARVFPSHHNKKNNYKVKILFISNMVVKMSELLYLQDDIIVIILHQQNRNTIANCQTN